MVPRRLSRLLVVFVQVPLGSFTAKLRLFTRFTEAEGVEAGSVHDRAMLMSSEPAPTENDQPRSSPVLTEWP